MPLASCGCRREDRGRAVVGGSRLVLSSTVESYLGLTLTLMTATRTRPGGGSSGFSSLAHTTATPPGALMSQFNIEHE